MLTLSVLVYAVAAALAAPCRRRGDGHAERGQASAEYALVLLGVAAVALLVSAWAARTDGIGRLFDAVMEHLLSQVR